MTFENVETTKANAPWMVSGSQQKIERSEESLFLSFGISWVAYPRILLAVVLRAFVFGILGMFVRQLLIWSIDKTMDWPVLAGVVLAFLWIVYDVLYLRSVTMYTDIAGVWLQDGVFPWEKGSVVIKWPDLGDVSYETGFFSWLLRSYTVRARSRFSNDEIYVTNLRYGNLAVVHIQRIAASLTRLGHIS